MSYLNATTLRCDRPDCSEHVTVPEQQDRYATKRALTALAESQGWQLSPHSDVPVDLCPAHVDLTRPGLKITRLYDEHGVAITERGRR